MIYDHTHTPHRFIMEDNDSDPNVVRVLDSEANLFAVEHYLDKGYTVQVAAYQGPWPEQAERAMDEGDASPLFEVVYPYLSTRDEKYGGWKELGEQDLTLLRMKDIFSKLYQRNAADWNSDALDRLGELYSSHPVERYLAPFMVSSFWAAVFVAGLGDPRAYVNPEDPSDTRSLFSFLGLMEESCEGLAQTHTRMGLRVAALSSMTFGDLGPAMPNKGLFETSMGRAFLRHVEEHGHGAKAEIDIADLYLIDGKTLAEATLIAIKMAAQYVFSVWWGMEYQGWFHPGGVFDEEGVEKFFSIFGRSAE